MDKYDFILSKMSILNTEKYCQKLVNTDVKRSTLFPGNYFAKRFGNGKILFHILKSKYLNDYDVAFKHLNEAYGLSKNDYKLYHPNLLRNDEYIKGHQNKYRDFDFEKTLVGVEEKINQKTLKKRKVITEVIMMDTNESTKLYCLLCVKLKDTLLYIVV